MSKRVSCTLEEIERHWSFDDLIDAQAMIDCYADAEDAELERLERKRTRRGST